MTRATKVITLACLWVGAGNLWTAAHGGGGLNAALAVVLLACGNAHVLTADR